LYGASENHRNPEITADAACWACKFVEHQIRRMLYLADAHVSTSDFDSLCMKLKNKLKKCPNQKIQHSALLRFMRMKARDFNALIDTLKEREEIESIPMENITKSGFIYKLL